jgi:hypothetical protein
MPITSQQIAARVLEVVRKNGPLSFRQIEAHLVLQDVEVSTFEVQRAVGMLVEQKKLIQSGDFRYAVERIPA